MVVAIALALAKSKRERACAMRLDSGRGREKVGGRRSRTITISGGGAMEAWLGFAIEKKNREIESSREWS